MIQRAQIINELIKKSPEYLSVKNNEKKMEEDEETIALLSIYQAKQNEYNDAMRFEKYGSNVDKIRRELSGLKMKVDTNSLVCEYNNSYNVFKKKLKEIEDIILFGIKE